MHIDHLLLGTRIGGLFATHCGPSAATAAMPVHVRVDVKFISQRRGVYSPAFSMGYLGRAGDCSAFGRRGNPRETRPKPSETYEKSAQPPPTSAWLKRERPRSGAF